MYDVDVLEAINIDQLVTPTDRLLVCGPRTRATRRTIELAREAQLALAASQRRSSQRDEAIETTMQMRKPAKRLDVGAAVFLVGSAWFGVVCGCLLA